MVHGSVECVDSECRGYAFDVNVARFEEREEESEEKKPI